MKSLNHAGNQTSRQFMSLRPNSADIILQFIAGQERGWDRMKGKRIALVYHDSPYGKEPIALLQKRSQMHGFERCFCPLPIPT
jgi:branched-chain amino acid transport system substrate-binding protein